MLVIYLSIDVVYACTTSIIEPIIFMDSETVVECPLKLM